MVYKVITLIIILPNKMKIIKQNSWRRISQSEIRNSAAESEDGQKFLPPQPPSFCPSERSVWRAKRAISSAQKRFGFRQTNAPELNFQEFSRPIQSREARKGMETLALTPQPGAPPRRSVMLLFINCLCLYSS